MKDYQHEVVGEKSDLDWKIDKLAAFVNSERLQSLPKDEIDRLVKQLDIMRQYSGILKERIINFK